MKNQTKGRPSSGMFIAFPDKLKNYITDVSPGHWRVQAAMLKFSTRNILLINSYFPTDPQSPNSDYSDLLETIAVIKRIMDINEYDHVIWTGDVNSDFALIHFIQRQ